MLDTVTRSPSPIDDFDNSVEANHRIANHLGMLVGVIHQHSRRLKQQGGGLPAAEVAMLLDGLGAKIEAVSRLHRRLAEADGSGDSVQLADYLNELSSALSEALPVGHRIGLDLELDAGCAVTPAQALPIGLIVCELVANATRHAHPAGVDGQVTIRCRRMGPELVVEVEDDGVGLPEAFDPVTQGGLGFRTVRALVTDLAGDLTFRNDGLGMVAELRVPASAPEALAHQV